MKDFEQEHIENIEIRGGAQPINELIDEHRVVRAKIADLWAKHGPFGVADNLRKAELSRISENIRALAAASGTKVTESGISDAAHSHKDYVAYLSALMAERKEYLELYSQMQEIEWRINRGQATMRYATVEIQAGGS